jgi:hypothetical protein
MAMKGLEQIFLNLVCIIFIMTFLAHADLTGKPRVVDCDTHPYSGIILYNQPSERGMVLWTLNK